MQIKKIVLIGAGNVAVHLGKELKTKGFDVLQVYSRTQDSAQFLAKQLECKHTNLISDLNAEADLYIFSLKDDALQQVIKAFPHKNKFVVHTSGSIPMSILSEISNRIGVLYPLQTFSKNVELDFDKIPLCIETQENNDGISLKKLAKALSSNVQNISSEQREQLHISAVFACNFTNYMYTIAEKILKQQNISFQILQPLIEETLRKTQNHLPSSVQTGPAARKDQKIINKHIDQLKELPDYQKIYNFISDSIMKENPQ